MRPFLDHIFRRPENRRAWQHAAAVLLAALLLSWPAFYNGFPLLYPDSLSYIAKGSTVARALFLRQFSTDYGLRSVFYSLGILPFHCYITLWPAVALQCLMLAWILWLTVRSFAPRRPVASYLALMFFLSALTSASWFAVFLMPDILGPVAYLAIYLAIFARQTLSRRELAGVLLLGAWSITAHSSHLLVAAAICLLLTVYAAVRRKTEPGALRAVAGAWAIVALAAMAQLAVYSYLEGKLSLTGRRPPFLMARVLADGPGRWYLEQHCGQLQWTVCHHLDAKANNPNLFLWGQGNAYMSSPLSEQRQLEAEEKPLVLAVLHTYPRQQLARSADNFWQQLNSFGMYCCDVNPWLHANVGVAMPRAVEPFLRSREGRGDMHVIPYSHLLIAVVYSSLLVIVLSARLFLGRDAAPLRGLGMIVCSAALANALVTGVIAVVDPRYQSRLIWLVPMLAAICLMHWIGRWRPSAQPAA